MKCVGFRVYQHDVFYSTPVAHKSGDGAVEGTAYCFLLFYLSYLMGTDMKRNLVITIILAFLLFSALFIVKYPLGLARDPGGKYYWNALGIYAKGDRNVCDSGFVNLLPCIDIPIPLISTYKLVPNADIITFHVLQYDNSLHFASSGDDAIFVGTYAVDKDHVFYENQPVYDGDVNTFVVADGYAKDRINIYKGGLVRKGFDTATYTELACDLYKDKNNVYTIYRVIPFADSTTFYVSRDCNDPNYIAEDKNFRYGYSKASGVWIAKQKEGSSVDFKMLSCRYVIVDGVAYYWDKAIKGADINTFYSYGKYSPEDCYHAYAKDKNHVYYLDYILDKADVSSFQAFQISSVYGDKTLYAFDNQNRFMGNYTINELSMDKESWNKDFDRAYAEWKSQQ